MAARAAWKARTTKPLGWNTQAGPAAASSTLSAQNDRRAGSSSSMPSLTASRALMPKGTARSMATHQMAQASQARGSAWVKAETAIARSTSASSSPRQASATGAVRMRLPLPALASGCSEKYLLAAAAKSPAPIAEERARRVCSPMSTGRDRYQSRKRPATATSSSWPQAVSSAMQIAIWVSSVHSPGSQLPRPPPRITASPAGGVPNSYPAPSASPAAMPTRAPAQRSRSSFPARAVTALLCPTGGASTQYRHHSQDRRPASPTHTSLVPRMLAPLDIGGYERLELVPLL
jgi:hypothetical protein